MLTYAIVPLFVAFCSAEAPKEEVMTQTIPGYTLGAPTVPRAPISMSDFEKIKQTALFTREDEKYLRMSADILAPQIDEILDVWYGFVGSNPHLLESFQSPTTGKPDTDYLGRVRTRFGQWIRDTAAANYDQKWLDYQFEIGRRHHRVGKNKTDNADAAAIVPFRYLTTLIIPITTTLKPFLAKSGHSAEDVEKMHAAWVKSVTIQVTLWCYPYMDKSDF